MAGEGGPGCSAMTCAPRWASDWKTERPVPEKAPCVRGRGGEESQLALHQLVEGEGTSAPRRRGVRAREGRTSMMKVLPASSRSSTHT